jgi:hypothetical protein
MARINDCLWKAAAYDIRPNVSFRELSNAVQPKPKYVCESPFGLLSQRLLKTIPFKAEDQGPRREPARNDRPFRILESLEREIGSLSPKERPFLPS